MFCNGTKCPVYPVRTDFKVSVIRKLFVSITTLFALQIFFNLVQDDEDCLHG